MNEETPQIHKFDSKGFLFFLKLCMALVLTMGATHITLGLFFDSKSEPSPIVESSSDVSFPATRVQGPETASASEGLVPVAEVIKSKLQTIKRIILPKKIEELIPLTGKFIAADLERMELKLFENGQQVGLYPIISKGREGSRWETPTGVYSVKTKENSHFSSIGEVYMPYSMQFYGNFFIHGWPYYPSGIEVPRSYSGGCIRLTTEDAKKVFSFATLGTPVYVYDMPESVGTSQDAASALGSIGLTESASTTEEIPFLDNTPVPPVTAEAYLVGELNDGNIVAEMNAENVYPMASISKLMTAIVSNDVMSYDKKITLSQQMIDTLGDSGKLSAGEVFTATELLYPLLMESSNDAAEAFARYFGYDHFIQLMNNKARALSMDHTHYADASGINSANTSTVSDLFRLAHYLYYKQQFILSITRIPSKTTATTTVKNAHEFRNSNIFYNMPNFRGGKTGTTVAAKEAMMTLFEVKKKGKSSKIVAIIVLRSDDRKKDIETLYNWYLQQQD